MSFHQSPVPLFSSIRYLFPVQRQFVSTDTKVIDSSPFEKPSRFSSRPDVENCSYRPAMYSFRAHNEASQTCRMWLLSPSNCRNQQCRYSHTITDVVSPPSMFICWAYNNGGCLSSQERCLFAHRTTGSENQYLQICRKFFP